MSRWVLLVGFSIWVASLAFVTGCATTYIPNTDVPDSGENRQVVHFCEQYRRAVEDKNVPALLKLAHPSYRANGGTAAGDDDIDYDGLREYLTGTFAKTRGIRYEMRYRKVTFTPADRIYVDYTYTASFKIPGVKADEWKHTVADNRLELVREGEGFRIVAGM